MIVKMEITEFQNTYLNELAEKHQISTGEVLGGLLVGFAINDVLKDLKVAKKPKKQPKEHEFFKKKKFAKRRSSSFHYLSEFGFSTYSNNETD
jgi:hypothetical protein